MNTTAVISDLLGIPLPCCRYPAPDRPYRTCRGLRPLKGKIDRLIESRRP